MEYDFELGRVVEEIKSKTINFGVEILFLIKIFFEISLSIANEEAITPECV